MATVSSYMILVNHYLNDYEKITGAEFDKLYYGDQSLNTQLEKDDSVDRYAAFSQKHPKSVIDIGESLMMLTNIIRVSAVTSLDNNHMRPSPASMRLFRSNNDLLLPLIEFLSKTGQFAHALHLLDTFTDKPYDAKHMKEQPYLQPKKFDLLFLCEPLKKYETDINLLEKTVSIFMKINAQKANKSERIFFSADAIEKFEEKFQPKDTLQKKLQSLSVKDFGQNYGNRQFGNNQGGYQGGNRDNKFQGGNRDNRSQGGYQNRNKNDGNQGGYQNRNQDGNKGGYQNRNKDGNQGGYQNRNQDGNQNRNHNNYKNKNADGNQNSGYQNKNQSGGYQNKNQDGNRNQNRNQDRNQNKNRNDEKN